MLKLLAILGSYSLVVLCGILTMIYGWGIQPVSWSWVIGGYVVLFLTTLIGEALKGCQ